MKIEQIKTELENREILGIEIPMKEDTPRDIIFGQLKRFKNLLSSELQKHDFKTFDVELEECCEKIYCFVEFEQRILGKFIKVCGPPVFDEKNCEAFLKKHRRILSGPRIEKDRIIVIERRRQRDAKDIIKALIVFLSARGKKPLKSMLKNAWLLEKEQLLRKCAEKEFAKVFVKFLKGREQFL